MTVRFDLTEADYVAWYRHWMFGVARNRFAFAWRRILYAAFAGGLTGLALLVLGSGNGVLYGGAFLAAALAYLLRGVYLRELPLRYAQRLIAAKDTALEPMTVSLLPQGLHYQQGDADVTLKWRAIRGVEATPTHFYVFFGGGGHMIGVPKRAFAQEAQRDEFLALLDRFRREAGQPTAGTSPSSPWYQNPAEVETDA